METKKQDLKRVIIYLLITFGLTWLYCLLIVYPIANGEALNGVPSMATQLVVAAAMFCPSIGVVLTRLVTREGFKNAWLRPHIKGNVKHYLLAWFGPAVLTFAGMGIYFLLFPGKLDLSFGYFTATLESTGAPMETLPMPIGILMLVQCVQALFLAPVMNFVTCFGEEWGWRGYLLPKMQNLLPTVPMLLVTGIIWGLWHAPLTIIGHGAVNGIAAIGIYFTHDGGNPFVGPAPTGIISMIPFMIVAAFMVLNLRKVSK